MDADDDDDFDDDDDSGSDFDDDEDPDQIEVPGKLLVNIHTFTRAPAHTCRNLNFLNLWQVFSRRVTSCFSS